MFVCEEAVRSWKFQVMVHYLKVMPSEMKLSLLDIIFIVNV